MVVGQDAFEPGRPVTGWGKFGFSPKEEGCRGLLGNSMDRGCFGVGATRVLQRTGPKGLAASWIEQGGGGGRLGDARQV